MAGYFPDVPNYRLAWDIDGTKLLVVNHLAATSYEITDQSVKNKLNDERSLDQSISANLYTTSLVFMFPRPIDLSHYAVFMNTNGVSYTSLQYISSSATNQTTNGLDGDWTESGSWTLGGSYLETLYRTNITAKSLSSISALRFKWENYAGSGYTMSAIHLYGTYSKDLAFWHPTLNQEVGPAYFDFGDVSTNTSEIKQFRIKNLKPSYTANNLTLNINVANDYISPTLSSQHSLSLNGTNGWTTNLSTGYSINSGSISPILYVKRDTPSNATLGVFAVRIVADATY